MAQADLFVLTSVTASDGDCEGLPVALIEAHASGLPVISTYHAGIPELVEDGSSGFLVNERDIAGVAAKMELLIEDDTLRKLLSMNAAQRVQSDFNIDILNNSLATLFIDGINRGRIRDDHNEHGRDLLSNSIDVDTTTVSLPFPDDDTRLAGNKYPYISLVIPMYNAESTLDLCLDSISKLSYPKTDLK